LAYNRNKSLTKAQKLLQKGKIEEAIKEYLEVVENDPSDVRTLLKIGDLQAKLGNIEAANDTYQKVGEHYAKDGFFLKAVAVFKQILKLDPGLIPIYVRLAELYQQLGLNSEAMKQYQVVARHYETQGLKKESLDILKKMAELEPDNAIRKIKLAELYAKEGHSQDSQAQFKTIVEDLKKKNNFQELVRVYEKMVALGSPDMAIVFELVQAYLDIGEPKKALSKLQQLFEADPKNPKTLELLAKSFSDLGQPEKANSVYTELVRILDEKGMIEERDRFKAKIRALNVSNSSPSFVSGVPSTPAPKPRQVIQEESPTTSAEKKTLDEAEVFIQYGLLDKACEILTQAAIRTPTSGVLRKKLIETFQRKGNVNQLVEILSRLFTKAQAANASLIVAEIQSEIDRLKASISTAAPRGGESQIALAELEVIDLESSKEIAAATIELSDEIGSGLEVVDEEEEELEENTGERTMFQERPAPEPKVKMESEPSSDLEISFTNMEISQESISTKSLESNFGTEENIFDIDSVSSNPEFQVERDAISPQPVLNLNIDEGLLEVEEEQKMEVQSQPEFGPDMFESMNETIAPPISEPLEIEQVEFEPQVEPPASKEQLSPVKMHEDAFMSEMEEAHYFVAKGLLDEAQEVYINILTRQKDYRPALRALAELSQTIKLKSEQDLKSQPKVKPSSLPSTLKDESASIEPEQKAVRARFTKPIYEKLPQANSLSSKEAASFFDLSNELKEEIGELESELSKPKPSDDEDYLSPEEVISEFKRGISRTVAKDDYQTHYHLGIAYKEMGLLDEAIHEFEMAQGDFRKLADCASMIGLCLMGKRDYQGAISVYKKILAQSSPQAPEVLGLSYELADSYIGNGNLHDAYKLFARIRDIDPSFRDVRRRAKELELDLGASAPNPLAPEKPEDQEKSVVKIPGKKNKISYI